MTLLEVIFSGLVVGAGLACGFFGYRAYGLAGAVVGTIAGWGGTFLAIYGIGELDCARHRRRVFPSTCVNGICRRSDFEFNGYWVGCSSYRCKCGTRFVAKGSQFLKLEADGTLKPFMRKKAFCGWEPDVQEAKGGHS